MRTEIKILKSFVDVEPYLSHVQQSADSERDALGFLPPNAYRQAAEQGKLFVAINSSGKFTGYLMFGGVFPYGKVMQIYTAHEFRKHGVAEMLMQELVEYAQRRNFLSLSAKVASDLAGANHFYERMGFQVIKTRIGGKTRKRIIYCCVRDLDTPRLFDLMAPKDHAHLSGFGISGDYSSKMPIYAVDLNILFDVSKQRTNAKDAELIFRAGFQNDIRPVIAEEFIKELERHSEKYPDDPHLRFALKRVESHHLTKIIKEGLKNDYAV